MEQEHEIPEAKDPFDRSVALTIAILAVVLAIVSSLSDNSRLIALLDSTNSADRWSQYQAKSIRGSVYTTASKLLSVYSPGSVDEAKREEVGKDFTEQIKHYNEDKDKIQEEAKKFEESVAHQQHLIHNYEHAEVLLHIAIVLGSIAILIRWKGMWYVCMALGAAGAAMAALPHVGFHV